MNTIESFTRMIKVTSTFDQNFSSFPQNVQEKLCKEIFPQIKEYEQQQQLCNKKKSITETLFIFSCKLSQLEKKDLFCLFFVNVEVVFEKNHQLSFKLVTTPFLKSIQRSSSPGSSVPRQVVPITEMVLLPDFVSPRVQSFEENFLLKPYFARLLNFIQLNEPERDLSSPIFLTSYNTQSPSQIIKLANNRSLAKVYLHTCFSVKKSEFHVLNNDHSSTTVALFHHSSHLNNNNKRSFSSILSPPVSQTQTQTQLAQKFSKKIKIEFM